MAWLQRWEAETGEADLHLGLTGGEGGRGVAVGDADDAAFEAIGGGRGADENGNDKNRTEPPGGGSRHSK